MGDRATNEMENLSLLANTGFPRDFLQRFTSRSDPEDDLGSGEEVELNLGLSLGGRFGVDKSNSNNYNNNNNNKLVRSSSIATILPVVRDDDVLVSGYNNIPGRTYSSLTRTTSLPVESEEEWRKRKELQSLRRLAAKRRRSEKQNNNLTKAQPKEYVAPINRQGSSGETSSRSQESSKPPSSPAGIGGRKNSIGKLSEDMPCVFTQGDGPNGRVVEGILYKYGKGEQVKIMCVCHGSFLSPAEFVKHAGGTDFVHPLKHIVVKPSSSF